MELNKAQKECLEALLAEYRYWRDADVPRDIDMISIGAIGAISNVIAALHGHKPIHHRVKGR